MCRGLISIRLRQIGRQHVVKRRYVGAALDAGMTAQRQDAAAGTADISQQALDDPGGTDDLHADGVVRPADGVTKGARCAPRPEFLVSASTTLRKVSRGQPVTRSTISGV